MTIIYKNTEDINGIAVFIDLCIKIFSIRIINQQKNLMILKLNNYLVKILHKLPS
jgi:hypothetical protein